MNEKQIRFIEWIGRNDLSYNHYVDSGKKWAFGIERYTTQELFDFWDEHHNK
jgi:hypothetical protein